MAMIDPEGLFRGERLAACSDRAQLYWARLYLGSNGYGRLELSYPGLRLAIFGSFHLPPSEEELWSVIEEYVTNFLGVVYQAEDGTWWLQFITSEKFLPRYKTARDEKSPIPPTSALEKQREGYIAWKNSKSLPIQRFQKYAENSGSFQKISVGEERSRRGVGDGEGEEKYTSPSALNDSSESSAIDQRPSRLKPLREQDCRLVYEAYPRHIAPRKALDSIERAIRRLVKGEGSMTPMDTSQATAFLVKRATSFANSPAGQRGPYTAHPTTWFNGSRYLDDEEEWIISTDNHSTGGAPNDW